ncbi:MAG: hypothetical protein A2Z29_00635 [Chloroflexi bacterium RBG_16_56_11]|nr:MAG: hypothetical protein A2Z29_00635 [Chloroflexi bacterium RBG_16_56_11]
MERIFNIIPASGGAYTFIWIFSLAIVLILLGVLGLFISLGYQAGHLKYTVNDEGLRISPGLYGRFIPREKIDSAGVKVINLSIDNEYQPKGKTNGSNLPGFYSGWFKLANKEKALVFLTDRSRVVYIPTNDNYAVLLSVREAEEFAAVLQRWE